MNKIQNEKIELLETMEMNDENYLNDLLETLKNMSNNLNIATTESSNETLFSKLKDIFNNIKTLQREIYELSFFLGFYKLEKADNTKISEKKQELNNKLNQLTK